MAHRTLSIFLACIIPAATLLAFDARYAPSEAAVDWRSPEDPSDRAAVLGSLDFLGTDNLMVGEVAVGGDPSRTFIAKLDEAGSVLWSKRLPEQTNEIYDNLSLAGENHMLVAYQLQTNQGAVDYLGLFNPSSNFSSYYTKSLPAPPVDPLNPFAAGRSFQAQRDGKVAIVQIEGSDVNVKLLNNAASEVFAKTYTLPSGDSPFPIPGFGLGYSFASLTELANGDFYLTSSGVDGLTQTTKAVVLRLSSNGQILWQRTIDLPATSAFTVARADEKILITGNGFSESGVNTPIVLLSESGQQLFAKTIDGAIFNAFSFTHFDESGDILLQGTIATDIIGEDLKVDGGILILADNGDKVAEAAYDIGDSDGVFHLGTNSGGDLYFELFGFSDTGETTHGILVKSDSTLQNWTSRSYLDVAGPSATLSSLFSGTGTPFITYRDSAQDWIYVNQLDANLQETGDCDVLANTTVIPYDPNFSVTSFSPTTASTGISVTDWATAPALSDASFALVDTPLTVENICGTGGGDPVSNWDDINPADESGNKQTEIGWINDSNYPYVFHHSTNSWYFMVPDASSDGLIFGWDFENGFWLVTSRDWQGWYYNLENGNWGTSGWDYWD